MATIAINSPVVSHDVEPSPPRPSTLIPIALALALGLILVANVPALICMPLDADVSLWDLFARSVSGGSVAYRDIFENNFPGMLWAHLAVRSLFGWQSETLRAMDAGLVATIILLLACWLPAGSSMAWRLFTALVLASFYLITSEWCHCQRDTWMLLPALLALSLQQSQLVALTGPRSTVAAIVGRGIVGGILWAASFWVKPYVAVPCILCWLVGMRYVAVTAPGQWRRFLLDGGAVLTGGILGGAAGCAWLLSSGAWADFYDVVLVWNREYIRFDMGRQVGWLYYAGPVIRLAPWSLVHLAAVPVAAAALWRRDSPCRPLLAALYLGWLGQAILFQHVYDYIHVPPLLLGIAVLCQQIVSSAPGLWRTLAVALLLLGVGTRLPAVTIQRLACWPDCIRDGSSVTLRDRLSALPRMNWTELDRVRLFLMSQGVGDGELTCLSMRTVPLYQDLGVRPSTRYLFLENVLLVFASQRPRVTADLAASRQRFLVCDVTTTRWRSPADAPRHDGARPSGVDPESVVFPHRGLLFRAGRYAVFSVSAEEMPDWIRDNLDL
jgi:hypothetical protein